MLGRRVLVGAVAALLARPAHSQPAPSAFIGAWRGEVSGVGPARLFITRVRDSGQVDGRMEFDLNAYVSTFGDKFDTTNNINYGVISGDTLTIEAALGGIYRLVLSDNRLSGTYSRGTTYLAQATFTKA